MPQLNVETYISQYFWLMVTLFVFYYFNATVFIPKISETLKLRRKLENEGGVTDHPESNIEEGTQAFKKIVGDGTNYGSKGLVDSGYATEFINSGNTWLKKVIK